MRPCGGASLGLLACSARPPLNAKIPSPPRVIRDGRPAGSRTRQSPCMSSTHSSSPSRYYVSPLAPLYHGRPSPAADGILKRDSSVSTSDPASLPPCELSKRPPLLSSIPLCRLLITIQPRNVLPTICPIPPTLSDSSRDQSRGPPEPSTSFDHAQKPGNRIASRVSICSPHLLAPAASCPLGINMAADSLHQAFDMTITDLQTLLVLSSLPTLSLFFSLLASSISTFGNACLVICTSFRLVSSSCKSWPSFQTSSRTNNRTSLLLVPLLPTPWSRSGPAKTASSALPCLLPSVLPRSNVTIT
ncbi:hypothetical protein IWX90DRAFT_247408 [Phyllosticta citrichinensis]|uniref:Uncharacterized protein n=1 Tax=Phyllosticta citrichinensis TaxID=1130410 RepID=A0ABR1XQT8_9PEZI